MSGEPIIASNELGMPALPGGDIVPATKALDGTLGFRIREFSAEHIIGTFEVADVVRQRMGLVHGGAYAALAEMLASEATIAVVYPQGMSAVGMDNYTSFLRPVSEGVITATGRRLHQGRSSWLWDVTFVDEQERVCATTRVTIAVRERRSDRPGQR